MRTPKPSLLLCVLLLCVSASLCSTPSFAETKSITIPKFQPDLPDADGREEFATSCLSCHSAAYIDMQPPMTAAKWEESVRKMQKTFGAPIPDAHVQPIVKYIVATKESGGGKIRELPTPPAATNDVVLPPADAEERKKAVERGEPLFATYCASCHGTDGTGNGPAGLALLPRPQDLTAAKFSDRHLANVVANGMPGTAMLPFGATLPKDDLRAVVAYASSLCTDTDPVTSQPTSESKALYLQNCASCHGTGGRADGPASATLPRPAASFHDKRPSLDYAQTVIADGIAGTSMPSWKAKLTDEQRLALAEYVRTFYSSAPAK